MFRYEVGAHILVKRRDSFEGEPIEVKILAKSPRHIKVEILTDGWFKQGDIRILSNWQWYSVGRVMEVE